MDSQETTSGGPPADSHLKHFYRRRGERLEDHFNNDPSHSTRQRSDIRGTASHGRLLHGLVRQVASEISAQGVSSDVFHTVLDYAGVRAPSAAAAHGASGRPLLEEGGHSVETLVPQIEQGAMVITLDPAAPFAGHLPEPCGSRLFRHTPLPSAGLQS